MTIQKFAANLPWQLVSFTGLFSSLLAAMMLTGVETARTAQTTIYKANSTTMNSATTDWTTTSGGSTYLAPAAGDIGTFDSTISSVNAAALALGGNVTLDALSFASTAPAVIIGNTPGSVLTLGAASGTSGISMSSASQNMTINCALTLGANQTWTVPSGLSLTNGGTLLSAGSGVLTVAGAGTVVLAGSANYLAGLSCPSGSGTAAKVILAGSGGPGNNVITNQINGLSGLSSLIVNSGAWTFNNGRTCNATNITINNGGTVLIGNGNRFGMSGEDGQSFNLHNGGALYATNNFAYRVAFGADGGTGTANATTSYSFTGTQDGGVMVIGNGKNFELGGVMAGKTDAYTLSGGMISNTASGTFGLGAGTGGNGTTTFTLSGTGKLYWNGTIQGSSANDTTAQQVFAFSGGTLVAGTYNTTYLRDTASDADGSLLNAGGTLAPGDIGTPGETIITGKYSVSSSAATLAIDLGGTTQASAFTSAASAYDYVSVSGTASLGGSLSVNLINSFVPTGANTFTILTTAASGRSGTFNNIYNNRVTIANASGASLTVTYGAANVVLGGYSALTALWTVSNANAPAGSTVTFTDNSSVGAITNWVVSFGDGSQNYTNTTSVGAGTTHTYAIGTYTATLTVYASDGSTATTSQAITATGNPTLVWSGTGSTWEGANDWLNGGSAATYADGDVVIINETGNVQPTITLNNSNAPSSVTISNSATTYTLQGPGKISNTASLIKTNSGTAIILTTNDYSGGTLINQGALQVGNGVTSGALGSGGITLNGSLIYNLPNSPTVNNTISGSGSLAKLGAGTLTLGGGNSYNGTTVGGGTVAIFAENNLGSAGGSLTLTNGGNLQVTTATAFTLNNRAVTVGTGGGVFTPANTLTITNVVTGAGGLTMNGAGTLVFLAANNYSGTTTVGSGLLQAGSAGTAGVVPGSLSLTGGNLTYGRTDNYTQAGTIAGSSASSAIVNSSTAAGNTNTLVFADGNNLFNTIKNGSAGSLVLTGSVNSVNWLAGYIGGFGPIQNNANGTLWLNGGTFILTNSGGTWAPGAGGATIINGGTVMTTNANTTGLQSFTGNLLINSGNLIVTAGRLSMNSADGQTFAMTGGNLILNTNSTAGNFYGLRLGGVNGANDTGGASVICSQSGGAISSTPGPGGAAFELGNGTSGKNCSYDFSGGNFTVNAGGTMKLGANATSGSVGFTNRGSANLVISGTLSGSQSGAVQTFSFQGGTVVASAINASNLRGPNDTANGVFWNYGGTLAPGGVGTPGLTTITGSFSNAANAVLAIDINGTTQASSFTNPGSYYDTISVSAKAMLAGSLVVQTNGLAAVSSASSFTILTTAANGLSGTFGNTVANQGNPRVTLANASGASFQVLYGTAGVILTNYSTLTPAFTPSLTAIPLGQSVTFTDTSVGAITNWIWNFGDGTTQTNTTSINPTHTYAGAGSFSATVQVFASDGSTATSAATVVTVTAPLIWTGASSYIWDIAGAQNWSSSGSATTYSDGKPTVFDDTGAAASPIALGVTVQPGSLIFSNSVNNYTISGSGSISGGASVTLANPGTVTLLTTNNYSGATTISAGTLVLGNGSTASGQPGTGTVTDNGTLVLNPAAAGSFTNTLAGSGALVITNATVTLTAANTGFTGSTVVSNGATVAISADNNLGAGGGLSLNNGRLQVTTATAFVTSHPLTVGAGGATFNLANTLTTATNIAGSGPIAVSAGTFQIGNNTATTNGASAFSLASGATLQFNTTTSQTIAPVDAAGTLKNNNPTGVITLNQSAGTHGISTISGSSGATMVLAGNAASTTYVTNIFNTAGMNLKIASGTWYRLGSGAHTMNTEIDGGVFNVTYNDFQWNAANQTFYMHGGSMNCSNSFGFRMGNNFGANNNNTPANFTGTQDAGTITMTQGSLELGNPVNGFTNSYTLSGGTFSLLSGVNLNLGAGTSSSTTAFTLSGAGKLSVGGTIAGSQGSGAQQVFAFNGGTLVANAINATQLSGASAPSTQGTFYNAGGALVPGDLGTAGKTAITGNYTVNSGTLAVDIGGATQANAFQNAGAYYDYLSVSGTATLGGNLNVSLINGFVPLRGNSFTILSAGSVSGVFANAANGSRFTVGSGSFLVTYTSTAVILSDYQGPALTWSGDSSANNWTDANAWLTGGSAPATYADPDVVLFTDGSSYPAVNLPSTVSPYSVTFSNTIAYSLSGAGAVAGTASLTKNNTGTVTIFSANTYSGGTAINAGVVDVQNNAALGTGAASVAATGAALQVDGSGLNISNALTLNGTGISNAGALHNLANNNTWSGPISLGGNARINSDAGTLTLSSGAAINSASALNFGGNGNVSLSSAIQTGANTLTKDGNGTLTLNANGTYSGGTFLDAGVLSMASANALGTSGTIDIAGNSTLQWNGITTDLSARMKLEDGVTATLDTVANNVTLGAALQVGTVGSGALVKLGTGGLTLGGLNTYSGGTTINGGYIAITNDANLGAAGGPLTLANGSTLKISTANITTTRTITLGSGGGIIHPTQNKTLTLNGQVTGAGGLTVIWDANSVVLGSALNNYAGNTTLGGSDSLGSGSLAIVRLGTNNALPYGPGQGNVVFLQSAGMSGLLDLNGNNANVNGLVSPVSTNAVVDNKSGSGTYTLTVGAGDTNSAFGGIIQNSSGNLALTKTGLGTLTLFGADTYTGNTTIGSGSLALSGSGSLSNTRNVIIAGGAVFDVSGLSSTFALGAGQTLTNISGTGIVAGNLNLASGALALNYTNGTPALNVTNGTLAFNNNAVTINVSGTLTRGTYKLISTNTGGAVASANLPASVTVNGLGTVVSSLSVSNGELYLTVDHPPVAAPMTVARTAGLRLLIALSDVATNWSDPDGDLVTLAGVNLVSTNGVTIQTNSSWILYPSSSPNANDRLSYSITDGWGGTNIGYINIVVNGSVTGTNSITGIITGTTNVVNAWGIPGYSYILERTTNLAPAVWIDVSTNTAATNGVINAADTFWDLGGVPPSSAFYQLKWQP